MNDRVDMFTLLLARDHQHKLLEEAGLISKLHQASEQSEPETKGSALARWMADLLGLRSRKQLLG